jgi:hypothetical protein
LEKASPSHGRCKTDLKLPPRYIEPGKNRRNHHEQGGKSPPTKDGAEQARFGHLGCDRTTSGPKSAHLCWATSYDYLDLAHGGIPRS